MRHKNQSYSPGTMGKTKNNLLKPKLSVLETWEGIHRLISVERNICNPNSLLNVIDENTLLRLDTEPITKTGYVK